MPTRNDNDSRLSPDGRLVREIAALASCLMAQACTTSPAVPECFVDTGFRDQRSGNAGCLIASGSDVLLIVHSPGSRLGFPGGTARSGETAQCTAHRETWEETGLSVSVGPFVRELSTGFLLYECSPVEAISSERVPPVAAWSRNEVEALVWRDLRSIDSREWRFSDQLDEVLDLPIRPLPPQSP